PVQLLPDQFSRLHGALYHSFDIAGLHQLLLTGAGLGKNPEDFGKDPGKDKLVLSIIQWAEAEDKVTALVAAAAGVNRSNRDLQLTCQSLLYQREKGPPG